MTGNRCNLRGGFTLVEILIVVVILGICSAIILPQIGTRDDLRAAAAARVVMSDLIYAQNLAISTQQTKYLRFGLSDYGLYNAGTASTALTHPVNKTPFVVTFGVGALRDVSLQSKSFDGQTTLAFDELGAPYAYQSVGGTLTPLASAGQITLRSGSVTLTINIEPFTGEVTVTQP